MKQTVNEQIVEITPVDTSQFDLYQMEQFIEAVKQKTDHFNIKIYSNCSYDGEIYSLSAHGDRFETEEEQNKRVARGKLIVEAWAKHDAKKNEK